MDHRGWDAIATHNICEEQLSYSLCGQSGVAHAAWNKFHQLGQPIYAREYAVMVVTSR